MALLHTRPRDGERRLMTAPALASYNKADDPDQLKLGHYLVHIVELATPFFVNADPLALELTVGLPGELPLEHPSRRDLDNYLQPVVFRLGHHRFAAAFGRKVHQDYSTLAIGPTEPVAPTREPDLVVAPLGRYDARVDKTDPRGLRAGRQA